MAPISQDDNNIDGGEFSPYYMIPILVVVICLFCYFYQPCRNRCRDYETI